MSLKLYAFEKSPSVPSPSYFCQKLETYLRAVNYTDYKPESTLPFSAPKGKLPYVQFPDGETLPDSHFIIRPLVETGQARDLDSDAGLSAVEKADVAMWHGTIDERVYPTTVWTRFGDDNNWAEFYAETLMAIPFGIRSFPSPSKANSSTYSGNHNSAALVKNALSRSLFRIPLAMNGFDFVPRQLAHHAKMQTSSVLSFSLPINQFPSPAASSFASTLLKNSSKIISTSSNRAWQHHAPTAPIAHRFSSATRRPK